MPRRQIYLDDESNMIWDELFGKGEKSASLWIRERLHDHKDNKLDPFFLMRRLNQAQLERQKWEAEIKLITEQLDTIKKTTGEAELKVVEIETGKVINMTRNIKQNFQIEEKKAQELAKKYLSLDPETRPDLPEFIKKTYSEEIHRVS